MSKDLLKGIPFEVVERDTGKKLKEITQDFTWIN